MARRMLHTSIWQNEDFERLSDKAKLLYIGMITIADDEGRLKANSLLLRSQVFPLSPKVSVEDVRKWTNEIVRARLIAHYKIDEQYFVQHPNWTKFQTLRIDRMRRSDIPVPEGEEENALNLLPNNSNLPREIVMKVWERDGEACRYCGKTEKPFHIDHVLPVSRGGKNTLENLVVSCQKCNTTKKDRLLEEIGWKLLPCPSDVRQMSVTRRRNVKEGKVSKDNNARKSARVPKPKKLDDTTPMLLKEYVEWMKSSPMRHMQIIGEWAEAECPKNETKGQWESFTTRNLRPARTLTPYATEKIEKAYHLMMEDFVVVDPKTGKPKINPKTGKPTYITKYGLETVSKYIDLV